MGKGLSGLTLGFLEGKYLNVKCIITGAECVELLSYTSIMLPTYRFVYAFLQKI